jgi:hypothetical protein
LKESHKFDLEKLNLRQLNELKVRKQYHINITKRSAAWENLSDSEDIQRDWENIKDHFKISAKGSLHPSELKQHKQ